MATLPDIAILGPGKVGTALGTLAARAGWPVRAVGGRSLSRARKAAGAIRAAAKTGGKVAAPDLAEVMTLDKAAGAGTLVLLTVPDDAIEAVCNRLARRGAFRPDAIVAHCSGALGSDVLQSAADRGCAIGSLHPLQTFPTVESAVGLLPGAYCFIEGDRRAAPVLTRLARAVGGVPFAIAPGAKALYHASACIASNYLVAIVDAALACGEAAGIPRAQHRRALGPLLRGTLENVLRMRTEQALTGPIARGDAATVQRHLEALRGASPDLAALYSALARWTIPLARRKGTLPPEAARRLERLMRDSHA